MTRDPLDRHASADRLRALAAAARLPDDVLARALALARATPDRRAWLAFLRRSFLILGAVLMLAAVVFFFAFNWAELTRFEKLGLIAAGIVAAAVAAWQWRDALPGEVALVSAAALVGPLLAVYGQTYQTGADPYELFTGWMLLILPWVLAARTSAAWVLWMVLANVALPLYWVQVVVTEWDFDRDGRGWALFLAQFALNAAFWIGWEVARALGARLAQARWPVRLLAVAALTALTVPTLLLIFTGRTAGSATVIAAGLLPFVLAAIAWRYGARSGSRDLFMVAVAMVVVATVATSAFGKALVDLRDTDASAFLFLGMLVIGEVTAMVAVLRSLARRET